MMKMKEKNFVSLVAYVRNDADRVASFLQKISAVLSENFLRYEIILVDDASTDETVERIKEAVDSESGCMVQIIRMSYVQGVEMAMNAGVDLAIGDFVYELDSITFDYDRDLIMKVYQRSLEGYDIVSAVPQGNSRYTSRLFYWIYNNFSSNQYDLQTERFRILSRRAINRIRSLSKTVPYRKALYVNCGLAQDSLKYISNREEDSARFAEKEADVFRWRMALDALIIFTDVGYKLALFLSMSMIIGSVLIALYVTFIFVIKQPVSGWASIMWLLSIGFAGTFALAAITIKYLDVIIGLVFKKKSYTFSAIEKITK